MSLNGRVQGDLTRYWSVQGVPIAEHLTVTYAPHDFRAFPIPDEVHERYVPELNRLAREEVQPLVDGDGNPYNPAPEAVVNRWLVESRAYTHAEVAVDEDALLETVDPKDPRYFDFFSRQPRKGVSRISIGKYGMLVDRIRAAYESSFVAIAEAMVMENESKRARLGEDLAEVILGPRVNLDEFIKAHMAHYDSLPHVH